MENYPQRAVVLFGIGAILWNSAPRLWTEFRHADEFVAAQNLRVTHYKCVNLKIGLFDRCTVIFVSDTMRGVRTITDWRSG
jgi:hypothetical protein